MCISVLTGSYPAVGEAAGFLKAMILICVLIALGGGTSLKVRHFAKFFTLTRLFDRDMF